MANGIVRRLDELGRITLPIEIRRRQKINEGDRLGINLVKKTIWLSKVITGMSRPVDELGRVVIPKEYRRTLKFDYRDFIDMWIEGEEICIRKAALQCVICGSDDEQQLMDVDGVLVCRSCGTKIRDKFKED
jgi:transcriptional pleiotropic regulator of transition state genes